MSDATAPRSGDDDSAADEGIGTADGGLSAGGSVGGAGAGASGDGQDGDDLTGGVGSSAHADDGAPVGGYGGTDDGRDAIVDPGDDDENTAGS